MAAGGGGRLSSTAAAAHLFVRTLRRAPTCVVRRVSRRRAPLSRRARARVEIRVDGAKFVVFARRVLPVESDGIGVWLRVLLALTRAGGVSHAAILV